MSWHRSWVRPFWRCCSAYASGKAFRGMPERRVKLFRNGRNQAVRIPREFELPGEDATIRREGRRLIIEPAPPKSLLAVLATLATLEEDFPPTEDRQAEPIDMCPMGSYSTRTQRRSGFAI